MATEPRYFVLECFAPLDDDPADITAFPEIAGIDSWMDASLITVPVPEPLEFELDPDEPGRLKEMYNLDMLLMSDRLVSALLQAGVDNLQLYRAVILDPSTGSRREDYRVVNIVGRVAAADLERSAWSVPSGRPVIDVDFESLAINERRVGDLFLFRLAECLSAIIVHKRVRDALLSAGFDMLTFLDPKDYVG